MYNCQLTKFENAPSELEQPSRLPTFAERISQQGPLTKIIIALREVENFDTVLWSPTGDNNSTRNKCDPWVASAVVEVCKLSLSPTNQSWLIFQHLNCSEVFRVIATADYKEATCHRGFTF